MRVPSSRGWTSSVSPLRLPLLRPISIPHGAFTVVAAFLCPAGVNVNSVVSVYNGTWGSARHPQTLRTYVK